MSRAPKAKAAVEFVPPTAEEVHAFADERGLEIDADYFVAYYEGVGWQMGRQPMKNWKAAVVAWVRRNESWSAGAERPRCEVCLRRGMAWEYGPDEAERYAGDRRLICLRCSDRLVRLGFVYHAPSHIPEVHRSGLIALIHPEPFPE